VKITQTQIESVLLGVAVGDALGVPVEFRPRGSFKVDDMIGHGTHNQPAGTWSDDTSLMLCLAHAMASTDRFTTMLENTAKNFCRWYEHGDFTAGGKVFDIGISTLRAIKRLLAGSTPFESGCNGIDENGNGSLMRIAPLVFFIAAEPQTKRFEVTRWLSAVTHAHPISVISCIIYVEYLFKLLQGGNKFTAFEATQKEIMDALMQGALNSYYSNEISEYFMPLIFPGNKWQLCDEGDIQSGGFVVDTLKASIWCFLTTDNYKDAVLKAVNLGLDTDTTAAVTGGLAGLYYGNSDKGIPPSWIKKLALYEDFSLVAGRIAEKCI